MLRLIPLFILLSGCSIYTGISVHPESMSEPEYFAPNPLGLVGGEMDCPLRTTCFVEHRSSIPYLEHGYGLNEVGVKLYFDSF